MDVLELEMVVVLGAAALIVLAGARVWRSVRRERHALARDLEHLAGDLRALCSAQSGAGDRLLDTEREVRRLARICERLEIKTPGQSDYRHAMDLARHGATEEELVHSLGLSRGEADLLCLLHRPESGSDVAA